MLDIYEEMYGLLRRGEISVEQWNGFCQKCIEEIIESNIDVLDNFKNM